MCGTVKEISVVLMREAERRTLVTPTPGGPAPASSMSVDQVDTVEVLIIRLVSSSSDHTRRQFSRPAGSRLSFKSEDDVTMKSQREFACKSVVRCDGKRRFRRLSKRPNEAFNSAPGQP